MKIEMDNGEYPATAKLAEHCSGDIHERLRCEQTPRTVMPDGNTDSNLYLKISGRYLFFLYPLHKSEMDVKLVSLTRSNGLLHCALSSSNER